MAFFLPINAEPDTVQRVQLGTETYDFRFRWNTYEEAWYCYLGLNGGDPKVQFKMVVMMDLLAPVKAYEEVPSGRLFFVDTEQDFGRPGFDNVGIDKRFRLFYLGEDEDVTDFIGDT